MRAKFLTEEERVLCVHRIRANNTGILNRELKWNQIVEAINPFQDPQGLLHILPSFPYRGGSGGHLHRLIGLLPSGLKSIMGLIPSSFREGCSLLRRSFA